MAGIDKGALKWAWTVFLFALVAVLLYQVRHTLVIFALAVFLSHLLAPVVSFFDRTGPLRLPRALVVTLVYVGVLAAVILAAISLGARIGGEAASLAVKLRDTMSQPDPLSHIPFPSWFDSVRPAAEPVVKKWLADLEQHVLPLITSAGVQILSGIGSLLNAVLIPILSFFFLKDGAAIRKTIVGSFPHNNQTVVNEILVDLNELLAQYIRALVLLSMAAFVGYTGFLSIASVPYAILLAGVAAIFEFIPVVGPLMASVAILLVAAFTGYPHLLWIVAFLAIYRLFQDYVLSPYLMSAGVEIHPLLVLFGVLAGEQIAGVEGMFFSVPVIAALRVIFVRLRRQRRAEA
ncbi:MAG TPA: AI-2E family transporter [Bryobacteraceae bacterium]|nr:AI-2E family transporter [Bryobacteraceae bacterium]